MDNLDLILAISSAVLSLFAGIFSARASRKARKFDYELSRREKQEDAAATAERILHQYREPLIDAAQTLQSRLFNIMAQNFLGRYYVHETDEWQRTYARDYTVYAIAEYLCWVEVLRREMRFQDLGDTARNQDLMRRLSDIQLAFQRDDIPDQFQVFRGRQRAIAEVMMVPTGAPEGPRNEAMGYASFCRRLAEDEEFASWFASLRRDVDTVAQAMPLENVRLVYLQRELIDLIDFLDPQQVRIPPAFRARLPEPDAATALPAQPGPRTRART